MTPKCSQNDPKIEPKNDQKSIQKTKRKKSQHETKIGPSETQKSLKNLRKINKNQKITYSDFDPILLPKRPQNASKMAPQNDQKTTKKTTRKKTRKKIEKRAQDDQKTCLSCERKAAFANAFRYLKRFGMYFLVLLSKKILFLNPEEFLDPGQNVHIC